MHNSNRIDSNTILLLGEIVHEESQMTYSSRDWYLLDSAEKVVNFKSMTLNGEVARNVLLLQVDFSCDDHELLGEETTSAFHGVDHFLV